MLPTLHDETFERISRLMYDSVGLSFAAHKKALVSSRLAARLQHLGLDTYEDYVARLEDPEEAVEFQVAVDLLSAYGDPHGSIILLTVSATMSRRVPEGISLSGVLTWSLLQKMCTCLASRWPMSCTSRR